ncbi:Nuclear transport factor 2 [Macleaya cordata]|uniref:Nuclear transport factor 2 n=1 Tax=Macleaya cordata TaxID=56857 RepID=A0A200QGE5_MACCD|nr:Nuclear transport factor 2 [Macleaya cordata]
MSPKVDKSFVKEYYEKLDTNPAALARYYNDKSLFSLDGVIYEGQMNILPLFSGSPFQPCIHTIEKADFLPLPLDDYVVVVKVVGTTYLQLPTTTKKNFSQVYMFSSSFFFFF